MGEEFTWGVSWSGGCACREKMHNRSTFSVFAGGGEDGQGSYYQTKKFSRRGGGLMHVTSFNHTTRHRLWAPSRASVSLAHCKSHNVHCAVYPTRCGTAAGYLITPTLQRFGAKSWTVRWSTLLVCRWTRTIASWVALAEQWQRCPIRVLTEKKTKKPKKLESCFRKLLVIRVANKILNKSKPQPKMPTLPSRWLPSRGPLRWFLELRCYSSLSILLGYFADNQTATAAQNLIVVISCYY